MSPLQIHLLKPRRQLFLSHQWLPINFPDTLYHEAVYHEALYHEAVYHVAMLLAKGIILLVEVVMFQAVEKVHLA